MNDCLFGGKPRAAQRFVVRADCENGSAESIAIDFTAPCELQMEQLTAHFEAIPTTSESIVLWKQDSADARYDTVLRDIDPSATEENEQDIVCIVPFRWKVNDHVRIDYTNTDDQDVGVEILLVQVF
jgi:hypothetical protein